MIGDTWWLDVFRVAGIVLAAVSLVLLVFRARRARRAGDRFTVPATAALVVFAAFVIAQELQQIGHPFTPWRLPMLMVGTALTLVAVSRSEV